MPPRPKMQAAVPPKAVEAVPRRRHCRLPAKAVEAVPKVVPKAEAVAPAVEAVQKPVEPKVVPPRPEKVSLLFVEQIDKLYRV